MDIKSYVFVYLASFIEKHREGRGGLEIIPQLSDKPNTPNTDRECETNLPRRSPFRLLMVAMAT